VDAAAGVLALVPETLVEPEEQPGLADPQDAGEDVRPAKQQIRPFVGQG